MISSQSVLIVSSRAHYPTAGLIIYAYAQLVKRYHSRRGSSRKKWPFPRVVSRPKTTINKRNRVSFRKFESSGTAIFDRFPNLCCTWCNNNTLAVFLLLLCEVSSRVLDNGSCELVCRAWVQLKDESKYWKKLSLYFTEKRVHL